MEIEIEEEARSRLWMGSMIYI
jgi:DNA polymerase epsilon subunit 1